MSIPAIDQWLVDLFRAIDTMDAATFAKSFTDDGYFRFGNADAVVGRDQVEANLAAFYTMIGGLSHEFRGVWSGEWDGGEVRSVESAVTYTRLDGTLTAPIPVTTTIRRVGDRIADYRVFGDVSPLFTSEDSVMTIDVAAINADREAIAARYLKDRQERRASSARGVHHIALLSRDVRATIEFYQGVLEFPLTEIFENRDYVGSNHFFFDIGHGNLLAFFDFPGLDLGPYGEVLGGLHHLAISVTTEKWQHLQSNLEAAGVEYVIHSGSSMYFCDPDGARIELIHDPLGEMYGSTVL